MTGTAGRFAEIAADVGVLSFQPAFVEGIERDERRFADLESAYRHIFRRNLEVGVLLWNAIPVPIDYAHDLPAMLDPLVDLLGFVAGARDSEQASFDFESPDLETRWHIETGDRAISIESDWRRISGGYEEALNEAGNVSMPTEDFLSEWKLLLQQLLRAFDDSGAQLTNPEARDRMKRMSRLEAGIRDRGRFYRY